MAFGGIDYNQLGATLDAEKGDYDVRGYTWNMIVDNFLRLFVTSAISLVCMIPAAFGMSIGLMYYRSDFLLIFGILGGAIAGPAYGAMYDAALMSYRGYSGRWWQRYVKVLKREWKGCILPGIAMGVLVAMIINILNSIMISGTVPNMMIISILIFLIAFMCIFTWFWPQKLMLDLDLKQLIKNSWLMTLMHPMKTFGAVALRLVYYVAMLVLYPYSLIFLIVLGDWFPSFMSVRIIYKTMDYRMNLDYRYEEALEEETADEEGDVEEDPLVDYK